MTSVILGGKPVETSGSLPKVGTQAPDFRLTGVNMKDFSLETYKGKNVVLNIFPSIDTNVCAASTRRFNQELQSLENTTVICVSNDLPYAFRRFCGAEGLENVVCGSEFRDSSFSDAYGVKMITGSMTGLMSRAVVVIDPNGKITHTEHVPDIGQSPNFEAALAALV